MGAFCVFGISRSACRKKAEKKVPVTVPGAGGKTYSVVEWGEKVRAMTEELFAEEAKSARVSPELDAPQFCHDWLAAQPGEVRQPVIMCRSPKIDKKSGKPLVRNGAVVMTWLEFDEKTGQPRQLAKAA